MASYESGYDDERFQHPVGQSFHCGICYNVIKDPVMCRHNEHLFCRSCITRHLMNSQTCPTCIEPLTVDTLTRASRTVTNLLSELKIRCEFFNRGCEGFVELGDLEWHVAECGFAPAVCSNEGCGLEMNKQDLLHHETAECKEVHREKCHNCNKISQEMEIVKLNLAAMNVKLIDVDETVKRNERKLARNEKSVLTNVEMMVQDQLTSQRETNRQFEVDNLKIKDGLNKVTEELKRLTQQQEDMKKSVAIAEVDEVDRDPIIVVARGWNGGCLNSVEMFSLSNALWTRLQPLEEPLQLASSVVYNNQIIVSGGYTQLDFIKSIKKLSMKAVRIDQSIVWENHAVELPGPLCGHSSIIFDGRFIVIGGYYTSFSSNISDISLVPQHSSKVLATMSEGIWLHGVVLFGSKIVILGGRNGWKHWSNLKSVLLYDFVKNECQELAPLPYPVSDMATVKWGQDNVIVIGGIDNDGKSLDKVLMYNVKTQKIHMLPDMKYKRQGCMAAVVRDTVIVMGGQCETGETLKSVESFRFDFFAWEELPEMQEARYQATAVVC